LQLKLLIEGFPKIVFLRIKITSSITYTKYLNDIYLHF